MNKHNFQVLTKKQQAAILGGRQLCRGSHEGRGFTVVEDDDYYFIKMQGFEEEAELTEREARDICRTFSEDD